MFGWLLSKILDWGFVWVTKKLRLMLAWQPFTVIRKDRKEELELRERTLKAMDQTRQQVEDEKPLVGRQQNGTLK